MAFKIIPLTEDLCRIEGDNDSLVGMITNQPQGWQAELMLKVKSGFMPSLDEARAYVYGAESAMRAFKVLPRKPGEDKRP